MAEKKTRKLVHDSDRKKLSKKTIIISSIVGGLLTITAIVLGVLWGLGVFEKEEQKYTYFNDLKNLKLNTVEVSNKIENKEHVFLFIYNNDELDAKEGDADTEFNEEHQKIVDQVKDLSSVIAEKNKDGELFYLYLIDTSVTGNETIYENTELGGITKDEDPAIVYFKLGTLTETLPEDEYSFSNGNTTSDYTISYKGTNNLLLINCIKDIKSFVRDLNV